MILRRIRLLWAGLLCVPLALSSGCKAQAPCSEQPAVEPLGPYSQDCRLMPEMENRPPLIRCSADDSNCGPVLRCTAF